MTDVLESAAQVGPRAAERCPAALSGAGAVRSLQAAFLQAMRASPGALFQSPYRFGGRQVRIRVVGRALAEQITRPFAHLQTQGHPSTTPELTIDLWDESETGIACPVASGTDDVGATWRIAKGFLSASPDRRFVRFQSPESSTWLDREAAEIVGWRANGRQLLTPERSKPLSSLLSVWHRDQDVHLIHAGLISRRGGGILIAGPGGSGKSTTTLACMCAGFDYLGDDYCGLQERPDGSFVGHSLYSTARLEPHQLARFPRLAGPAIQSDDPDDEKWLIPLAQVLPGRLARAAPIRALALPRVADADESRIRRASKGEAFLRIAPSSLVMLLTPGPGGLDRLARLVERVPSYWLDLGRDLPNLPTRVEELLARATSG